MSTRIWMTMFVILWIALFLFGCGYPNPQPPGLTPIPSLAPVATGTLVPALQASPVATKPAVTTSPAAAAGGEIFAQNCAACHGTRAEGGIGPALRNSKFIQTAGDQAISSMIAKGRPGTAMPAWLQANGGKLTEAQINNVIAFLKTLQ
jgi:mono/diheme cytochrome c family protein